MTPARVQATAQTTDTNAESSPQVAAKSLFQRIASGVADRWYALGEGIALMRMVAPEHVGERLSFAVAQGLKGVGVAAIWARITTELATTPGSWSTALIIGLAAHASLELAFGFFAAHDQRVSAKVNTRLNHRVTELMADGLFQRYEEACKPEMSGRLTMVRENVWRIFQSPQKSIEFISAATGVGMAAFVMATQAPWPVAVAALAAVVVPTAMAEKVARFLHAHEHSIQHIRRASWYQSYFMSNLESAKQLLLLRGQSTMRARMSENLGKVLKGDEGSANLQFIGDAINNPIKAVCGIFAATYMIGAYHAGTVGLGEVAFVALSVLPLLSGELTRAVRTAGELLTTTVFLRNFRELSALAAPPDAPEKEVATNNFSAGGAELKFCNVSFSYGAADTNLFEQQSLTIKSGKFVALWGRNGCGKSTFFEIASGILTPTQGQVTIDGTPLETISMRERYGQIGYVLQRPFLFESLSIRENITIGVDSVDQDLLARVCMATGVTDFIEQRISSNGSSTPAFPQGLDTILGRDFDGAKLSGGQQQMVALARALIRCPKMLFLDEPTSAMDTHEAAKTMLLLSNLEPLLGYKPTVIMITHDHHRVRLAERIIVLGREAKGLVEEGSHAELMQLNGIYAASIREATYADRQHAA